MFPALSKALCFFETLGTQTQQHILQGGTQALQLKYKVSERNYSKDADVLDNWDSIVGIVTC
jgi:hypothetical protein